MRHYLNVATIQEAIRLERQFQDDKWGGKPHDRDHTMAEWALILSREVGEAMDALGAMHWERDDKGTPLERYAHTREELIQIAAVAVAIIEVLDQDAENGFCDECGEPLMFASLSTCAQCVQAHR